MIRRQLTTADLAGQDYDGEDHTSNHPGDVVAVVDVLGILRWVGDPLRLVVGRVGSSAVLRSLDRPLGRVATDGSHVDDGTRGGEGEL